MFNTDRYWITTAETKGFMADAAKVFTVAEYDALTQCISISPTVGDVVPDTNGVRLLRWPAASQGKRARVRVLYYFRDLNTPVFLLALYARGERFRPSSGDARMIRALVAEIVTSYGVRQAAVSALPGGAA